jgi:hypothetical protein
VPYSQLAGVGGAGSLTVYTDTVNKEDLIKALKSAGQQGIAGNDFRDGYEMSVHEFGMDGIFRVAKDTTAKFDIKVGGNNTNNTNSFTLADLLKGERQYTLYSDAGYSLDNGVGRTGNETDDRKNIAATANKIVSDVFIDWLEYEFAKVLEIPNDPLTSDALAFVSDELKKMFEGDTRKDVSNHSGNRNATEAQNYLGVISSSYDRSGGADANDWDYCTSVNLNNLAEAYLTLYAQFMEGELASSNPTYSAQKGSTMGQKDNWVTSDPMYLYNIYVGQKFSAETAKMAAFYDTILNQLCVQGWTEDVKVVDNKHLEELLTNGKAFVSRLKDDGYYYQGNYATDIYIKVVTDDSFIAKAEAKYNSEKNKLNQKEQMLDMKMKNLDTEISALTTEYDTIKSTISKNIEKTFKRYSA